MAEGDGRKIIDAKFRQVGQLFFPVLNGEDILFAIEGFQSSAPGSPTDKMRYVDTDDDSIYEYITVDENGEAFNDWHKTWDPAEDDGHPSVYDKTTGSMYFWCGAGMWLRWACSVDYVQIGENVDADEILYLNADGKYYLAKADSSTTLPAVAIALETDVADAYIFICNLGDVPISGYTARDKFHVSATTAGAISTSDPGSPYYVQIIGYAKDATEGHFDFSSDITKWTS